MASKKPLVTAVYRRLGAWVYRQPRWWTTDQAVLRYETASEGATGNGRPVDGSDRHNAGTVSNRSSTADCLGRNGLTSKSPVPLYMPSVCTTRVRQAKVKLNRLVGSAPYRGRGRERSCGSSGRRRSAGPGRAQSDRSPAGCACVGEPRLQWRVGWPLSTRL